MDEAMGAVLDAIGELVVVRGPDRRITYVNAAVLRAFGGRREDWIGRALASIMFEETAAPAHGGRWRVTGPLRTVAGPLDMEWEETRLPDGGSVAVGRDVTVRLAHETALREDRAAAEARARDREALFAMITHELRTPAAGMAGLAEVLADTSLTTAQASYVEALRAGGRHLLKLVDDTLDLTRLEAGAFDLAPQPTDLGALVAEVGEWLAPQAHHKGLELAIRLDPALPALVEADAGRVRQIALNLGGNAVKFTDAGGVVITVERDDPPSETMAPDAASRDPASPDQAPANADDEAEDRAPEGAIAGVRLVVEDTGPGVPEAKRGVIFEAFAQAQTETESGHQGAGLGLAIARRLAEAMGGDIGFETEMGRGSRFWARMALPILDSAPLAKAEALAALQIGVAAPEPLTRHALARQVAALGAQVTRLESVAAARAAATDHLLLVDEAWADAITPGARGGVVLVRTERREAVEEWLALGYGGWLVKPVRVGSMIRWLTQAAAAPRRREGAPALRRAGAHDSARASERPAEPAAPRPADPELRGVVAGARGDAGGVATDDRRSHAPRAPRSDSFRDGVGDAPRDTPRDTHRSAHRGGPPPVEVLLVEDDDVNRFLARAVLLRLGARVTDVTTAADALAAAEAHAFDIIFMDVRLPDMDGAAATRRLRRSRGPSARAPVIAVTANAREKDREACLAAGMNDVFVKPAKEAELREALERWTVRAPRSPGRAGVAEA